MGNESNLQLTSRGIKLNMQYSSNREGETDTMLGTLGTFSCVLQRYTPVRDRGSLARDRDTPVRDRDSPARDRDTPVRDRDSLARDRDTPARKVQ